MTNIETHEYKVVLKSLSLNNFRGFSDLPTLEFDPKLTILIGNNGSGKTSILDAIAEHLRYFLYSVILKEKAELSFNRWDVKNGSQLPAITKTVFNLNYPKFIISEDPTEELGTINKELNAKIEIITNIKGSSKVEPIFTDETENLSEEDLAPLIAFKKDFQASFRQESDKDVLPVFVYYGCNSINTKVEKTTQRLSDIDRFDEIYRNALNPDRFSFNDFYEWYDRRYKEIQQYLERERNIKIIEAYEFLKKVEINTITNFDAETQLIKFKLTNIAETPPQRELRIINDAIIKVFEDGDNQYFSNVRIEYKHDLGDEMQVDKQGNGYIAANQMSSGERNLFALVGDLARRMVAANRGEDYPLLGQGVVLIDELELHLHPKWQQTILSKMGDIFPNIQFIVTTHSPIMISNLEIDKDKSSKVFEINDKIIEEIKFYKGKQIKDVMYEIFGIKSRPDAIQSEIDKLFEAIEYGHLIEAKKMLANIESILGEEDAAVIDAKNSIELNEEDAAVIDAKNSIELNEEP